MKPLLAEVVTKAFGRELHVSHTTATVSDDGLLSCQALCHSLRNRVAEQDRIYRAHNLANERDTEKIQSAWYLKMLNRGLWFPE